MAMTTTRAATAPRLAGRSRPVWPAPMAMTMKTTSVPSSMVMLKAAAKAILSHVAEPMPRRCMASVLFAKAACSSWRGIWPAERRIALRSQRRPNERSVPTASWTMGSGMWASAVPSMAMMISRTTMAVAVPVNADRQPRTLPTARTTVRASTHSTERGEEGREDRRSHVRPVLAHGFILAR